ncbi:MAG TPA: 30S ribosomal protein S20 [Actinomycetota bacterium]|nr:30S ribosomal protein S20 [Actinomycetota bacterium]
MANIKSQIKRNRQNETRRLRNKSMRSALKTGARGVREAHASGDAGEAQARLRETSRALDKAAAKGTLHKRRAADRKSRLARSLSAPGGE